MTATLSASQGKALATGGQVARSPRAAPAERRAVPSEFRPSPPPASGQHPFIVGLLDTLPEVGTVFPMSKRRAWADAALAAFAVIYELPPEEQKGGGDD